MPTVKKSFSIDKHVERALSACARKFGLSRSKIVSELLKQVLPKLHGERSFKIHESSPKNEAGGGG